MTVSAVSAAISSFSGLHALALVTGWHPWVAPLFPLTIDAWAMTATRVWLAASTSSQRARRFARRCAVGAILMSLAGNAVWHLIGAHLLDVGWAVVLVVGAMPPVVLGLVTHLAVLRKQVDLVVPGPVPSTVPSPVVNAVSVNQTSGERPNILARRKRASSSRSKRQRYGNEDELLAAAKAANAAYQAAHNGRGITRDALRAELRVGGGRATAVLRRLRAESGNKAPLSIPQQERA